MKPIGPRALQLVVAGAVVFLLALTASVAPPVADPPELVAADARARCLAAVANDSAASRGVGARGRLEPAGGLLSVGPGALPGLAAVSVARLLVAEGDTVRAGQVIAVLDCRERFAAAAAQAEQQVAATQQQWQQAQLNRSPDGLAASRATVDQLQHEYDYAVTEYTRQQELHRIGYSAEATLAAQRARMDNAAGALARARAQLTHQAASAGHEADGAAAGVARARAALDQARQDLRASEVLAPVDGRVIEIIARPGEQVGPRGVVLLGNTQVMEAVAEVFESDVRLLRPGQAAVVTSVALPGPLPGVITAIGQQVSYPTALDQRAAAPADYRIVEVRVRLHDSRAAERFANLVVDVAFPP